MAGFRGGSKLEAHLRDLASKLAQPRAVRVGFLEGSTYPDGTSLPMVAAIQEFGAPAQGIPARPFFRTMIAAKSPEWGLALGALVKDHGYEPEKALAAAGDGIKGQLQQSIVDFEGVPLSAETVARKGNDKQLVDTGHMLNSVDYEVKS